MDLFNRLKEKCLYGEITFDEFWEELIRGDLTKLDIRQEHDERQRDFVKVFRDYLQDSFEFQKSLLIR
jgi:hypothetical protein